MAQLTYDSDNHPVVQLSDDDVFEWLRSKVDGAGFEDSVILSVQLLVEGAIVKGIPRIDIVLSDKDAASSSQL